MSLFANPLVYKHGLPKIVAHLRALARDVPSEAAGVAAEAVEFAAVARPLLEDARLLLTDRATSADIARMSAKYEPRVTPSTLTRAGLRRALAAEIVRQINPALVSPPRPGAH